MADFDFNLRTAALSSPLLSMATGIGDSSRRQMQTACGLQETEVKRRCPVDTGNLRASYSTLVETRGDRIIGHVGTNVDYAPYVEYGTSKMGAQPHVRPALEANRDRILELLGAETLQGVL